MARITGSAVILQFDIGVTPTTIHHKGECSLEVSRNLTESETSSDAGWHFVHPGSAKWSGSAELEYDEDDPVQKDIWPKLIAGTQVDMTFKVENDVYAGLAYVESAAIRDGGRSSPVMLSLTWRGHLALVRTPAA
jgi:hypothetical protein